MTPWRLAAGLALLLAACAAPPPPAAGRDRPAAAKPFNPLETGGMTTSTY